MKPLDKDLNTWTDRALSSSGLPSFYDYAKARTIAKEAAKAAYEAGANDELRECCAALGRYLPEEIKADVIRMLKDSRRPRPSRQEASVATYCAVYRVSGAEAETERDLIDKLCRETKEKYGGLW